MFRVVLGVIPKAIVFQPLQQPSEMDRDSQLQRRVGETEARSSLSTQYGGPSVSAPKPSLFPPQQLSLPEVLAKVILGEMLLDLKKYNLY